MKKTYLTIIIISIIALFYTFAINVQGNLNVKVIDDLELTLNEGKFPDDLKENLEYRYETIKGASKALLVNSWIVIALTSINFAICGYSIYKNRRQKI